MTAAVDARPRSPLVRRLTALGLGTALALLCAEGVLRFLPVSTGLGVQPVHAGAPVLRFAPGREFVYSKGLDFAIVNRGWVNEAGFINDQTYVEDAATPLLAVIGDSYVEAQMVPYEDTLHGRLAARAGDRARVYSFAASGAALSQYLAYAEHAAARYRPDAMAFVVVGNDFDESLLRFRRRPGHHAFAETADGGLGHRRIVEVARPSLGGRGRRGDEWRDRFRELLSVEAVAGR